jgi:hypothetical protein
MGTADLNVVFAQRLECPSESILTRERVLLAMTHADLSIPSRLVFDDLVMKYFRYFTLRRKHDLSHEALALSVPSHDKFIPMEAPDEASRSRRSVRSAKRKAQRFRIG